MSLLCATRRILGAVVVLGTVILTTAPAHGHVLLDEPNGGEVLGAGSVFVIEWHILVEHGTQDWDLSYSITGDVGPWIPIATDLPPGDITAGSIHTYPWTVPDTPSVEVRVRVRQDNALANYVDDSDANLTIGAGPPACVDVDEDGYGSPGNAACPNGAEEDCDDGDPGIHPGAAEICDDTVDNDCDGWTDLADPECSDNTVVLQVGLEFDPADIIVAPGDTIEWRFSSGVHTVTSGSVCSTPDGRFDMPLNGSNTVVTYTVPLEEPGGVIPYYCTPHCGAGMTGTITVSLPDPIPTVSAWGMVAIALLLLVAGTIVLDRRVARIA